MNILAIGTTSDTKNKHFTGQSIMFDGMVYAAINAQCSVDVINISSRIKCGKFGRIMDYIIVLSIMFFKMIFNKYDITYIVSSQSKWGFYRDYCMVSLSRLFKTPVVTHQYGANYLQMLNVLSQKDLSRLKKITNYISNVIVEGDYMKNQFSFFEGYEKKVVVIPNGLPIEGNHIMKEKYYSPSEPYTLFYLSNLIYSKGYFDVLKAVDLLVNREKLNVNCIFAGRFMSSADDKTPNISNQSDFEDFISTHNLKDHIQYFQGLYGEEKDIKFYEANSFILPTYYINEGQPVSIIEAMAYGCVPIVTKYRHIPMMVDESNGLYVDPQSPESICQAVKMMIANPSSYHELSRKSILDYQNKFKFDVYSSKVLNVFKSIVTE